MRCGKCKTEDATIDAVRACYAGIPNAHLTAEEQEAKSEQEMEQRSERWFEERGGQVEGNEEEQAAMILDAMLNARQEQKGPMWAPSDKQVDYLLVLQDDRVLPEDYTVKTKEEIEAMERPDVSAKITLLKNCQRKNPDAPKQSSWSMPEGRYALHWEGDGWHFYQVDKPTEGRWAGYTFVKQLIGSPGQYRKVNVPRGDRQDVLQAIEEDPKAAMTDYGKHTQVCGRCASPLTDKTSRALGMGPVCRGKSDWF